MKDGWIVGNIRQGYHHSSFFFIKHTKKNKDDKREQEILINNSGIRAINRQYWIFRTLEGWSQLRWRRTGSQPSSNGISQCSVLCVDWAALHHGAGRFSWLHAAVHLLCLQDHPPENLHGRLRERESETHTQAQDAVTCLSHTILNFPAAGTTSRRASLASGTTEMPLFLCAIKRQSSNTVG